MIDAFLVVISIVLVAAIGYYLYNMTTVTTKSKGCGACAKAQKNSTQW